MYVARILKKNSICWYLADRGIGNDTEVQKLNTDDILYRCHTGLINRFDTANSYVINDLHGKVNIFFQMVPK